MRSIICILLFILPLSSAFCENSTLSVIEQYLVPRHCLFKVAATFDRGGKLYYYNYDEPNHQINFMLYDPDEGVKNCSYELSYTKNPGMYCNVAPASRGRVFLFQARLMGDHPTTYQILDKDCSLIKDGFNIGGLETIQAYDGNPIMISAGGGIDNRDPKSNLSILLEEGEARIYGILNFGTLHPYGTFGYFMTNDATVLVCTHSLIDTNAHATSSNIDLSRLLIATFNTRSERVIDTVIVSTSDSKIAHLSDINPTDRAKMDTLSNGDIIIMFPETEEVRGYIHGLNTHARFIRLTRDLSLRPLDMGIVKGIPDDKELKGKRPLQWIWFAMDYTTMKVERNYVVITDDAIYYDQHLYDCR